MLSVIGKLVIVFFRQSSLSYGASWQFMKTTIVARKLSQKQSREVAAALRKIEKECSIITPKLVVEQARSPKHPLHKFFQWDDSQAAELYRQWQARMLIATVYVVPSDSPNSEPVRAFVNIQSEEEDELVEEQGYVWTAGLENRPNYKAQVMAYAHQQLHLWRKKFGAFQEFYGVVKEIDALK